MSKCKSNLRAGESIRKSYVRFFNLAPKKVDVIWINYEGNGVVYKSLAPRDYLDVNTYVSHPWIFRDSVYHDKMVVYSCESRYAKNVYQPQDINGAIKRKLVFITLPIYSLKERCFQILRENKVDSEKIEKIHLPKSMKEDYKNFIISGIK